MGTRLGLKKILNKLITSKDVETKCSVNTNIRTSEGNTELTYSKYSNIAFQVLFEWGWRWYQMDCVSQVFVYVFKQ